MQLLVGQAVEESEAEGSWVDSALDLAVYLLYAPYKLHIIMPFRLYKIRLKERPQQARDWPRIAGFALRVAFWFPVSRPGPGRKWVWGCGGRGWWRPSRTAPTSSPSEPTRRPGRRGPASSTLPSPTVAVPLFWWE